MHRISFSGEGQLIGHDGLIKRGRSVHALACTLVNSSDLLLSNRQKGMSDY
jgi:hypothetical protein